MGRILIASICLLSLCVLSLAQNGTESSGSGSGSGSGMRAMRNCSDLRCSHGCSEAERGPECYCPPGYSLGQDLMTCQPCPGGRFGVGCSQMCNCGSGNTCDRANGTCICNPCYSGDQCLTEQGGECFVQFLGIADKSYSNLRDFYGFTGYPTPPTIFLETIAADIMEIDRNLPLISNVQFEAIDRSSVFQQPLLKLSWLVDKSPDRITAERALSDLSDKVKLGDIRATYIAQDSADTTLVTLNAGVKGDPV